MIILCALYAQAEGTYRSHEAEVVFEDVGTLQKVVCKGAQDDERYGLDGGRLAEEVHRPNVVLLLKRPDELQPKNKRKQKTRRRADGPHV